MTVTYTAEVATCKKFGCFIKLLCRWRGSIYKIIWMDLILFLTLYYCINVIYMHVLEDDSKRTFESIVYYCASYSSLIPLSFVLGFYVNLVMTRWWEQYTTIPWPDSIAVFVSAHVHGQDEGSRVMRRTVMRYVCLCLTIVFTMISPCVKKRFPKMKNLVDAGLLLENEKKIIEAMDCSFPKHTKHWMPIVWAASIITRARKEGRIRDDFAVKTIIDELNTFRGLCGTLMYYDFISIPLVYTQVVTIAVYSFFVCSLLAHQWTDNKKDTYEAFDFYSPVFITLQFFFYMGWLKVAETLINPFGEDDDDFEVNWMIDRNLQVSYLIVDEMHHEHPELVKDQYWDEVYPNELPYESDAKRDKPPEHSTAKYDLEELPKRDASKITSSTNSILINGKSQASIQSGLNQRSQRFNEAFQRFFNYSEEDTSSLKTDVENSFQSVSEIENITSYTRFTQSEYESQLDNESTRGAYELEPVLEEDEEASEAEGEEMFNIQEEENYRIETQSSYESDSDSDPFERLRIERQQQRLQKQSDFLERHFGSNYRIVSQYLEQTHVKNKSKTEDLNSSNQRALAGEIIEEQKTLTEKTLTPAISTDHINLDIEIIPSLIDEKSENNNELLTPKLSKDLLEQTALPATLNITSNNKLHQEVLTDNENSPSQPSMLKESFNEIVNLNTELEKNSLLNVSLISPQQDSLKQMAPAAFGKVLSSPLLQRMSTSDINLQREIDLSETHQPGAPTFATVSLNIKQNSSLSNEPELLWKSQGTSPLGSARSVSTQSSFDDFEILPSGSATSTVEQRLKIEDSESFHNA